MIIVVAFSASTDTLIFYTSSITRGGGILINFSDTNFPVDEEEDVSYPIARLISYSSL